MTGQRLALQWWSILASVIICGGCEVPDKPAAPKFIGHEGEEEFSSDSGADIEMTYSWTAPTGRDTGPGRQPGARQPNFRLCVTRDRGTGPGRGDSCYDFDNVNCTVRATNTIAEAWVCSGSLALPSELEGRTSDWYVRSVDPDDRKLYANSNVKPFSWEILRPNLTLESPDYLLGGNNQRITANILNNGQARAGNFVVRFEVSANDGTTQTTLMAPDQIVAGLDHAVANGFDGKTAAASNVSLAGLARPVVLIVVITVDPDNDIAESDDSAGDNTWREEKTIF